MSQHRKEPLHRAASVARVRLWQPCWSWLRFRRVWRRMKAPIAWISPQESKGLAQPTSTKGDERRGSVRLKQAAHTEGLVWGGGGGGSLFRCATSRWRFVSQSDAIWRAVDGLLRRIIPLHIDCSPATLIKSSNARCFWMLKSMSIIWVNKGSKPDLGSPFFQR